MKELRQKLIISINRTVDEFQCLGADQVADGIIKDVQEVELITEMKEHLWSIASGAAFDKETGLIWTHRLESIKELLNKINPSQY